MDRRCSTRKVCGLAFIAVAIATVPRKPENRPDGSACSQSLACWPCKGVRRCLLWLSCSTLCYELVCKRRTAVARCMRYRHAFTQATAIQYRSSWLGDNPLYLGLCVERMWLAAWPAPRNMCVYCLSKQPFVFAHRFPTLIPSLPQFATGEAVPGSTLQTCFDTTAWACFVQTASVRPSRAAPLELSCAFITTILIPIPILILILLTLTIITIITIITIVLLVLLLMLS